MNYSNINYVIFNNRSQNLVSKFLPEVDIPKFIELEKKYKFVHSLYKSAFTIPVDEKSLNLNYTDILYTLDDIKVLKDKLILSNTNIKGTVEYDFLKRRNISDDIIDKYKIATLSSGWSKEELDFLGFSLHPLLKDVFYEQIAEGIIIPYFNKSDELINAAIRRFENGPLKYSLAVPDVNIFGISDVEEHSEIWICEGIIDCMALMSLGINAVSVSSASWSSIQLYQLLEKKPSLINIFSDYDYTGLKTAGLLKRFFNLNSTPSKIWISDSCKDAAEHIFENGYDMDKVEETAVTPGLLEELEPIEEEKTKNYIEYLKSRTF
jgi:DNA primase